MTEDFRAWVHHDWAMHRLEEVVEAIRQDIRVIDEDIASIRQANREEYDS